MKKNALLLIISLGFLNQFNAMSQTKEETVGWLKARLATFKDGEDYNLDIDNYGKVILIDSRTSKVFVDFQNVTDVDYLMYSNAGEIHIGGNFIKKYGAMEQFQEKASSIEIVILHPAEDRIKSIVKAFKHLATLCGGKVVSEELFKN